MPEMSFSEEGGIVVARSKVAQEPFKLKGSWGFERYSKDGILLAKEEGLNLITDEGCKQFMEIMFRAATQLTTWYFGLIDNAGIGAGVAVGDTLASHAGWAESTAYTEANRQAWSPGAASGTGTGSRSLTNGTAAAFSMNTNGTTLYGFFIASNNTKGGTSGKLWSGIAFSSIQPFNSGDSCKLTYTLSA